MSVALAIRNRQRTRRVETRLLRRIVTALVREELVLESVELGIALVGAPEMARVNWQFLQHEGATDVITFDHTETQESRRKPAVPGRHVCGELYVCVAEAVAQAKTFRTIWPVELVRYIVHGILHLLGHDDQVAAARHRMKREENRLVRLLARRFDLAQLALPPN
jgi:probable rRNA maturation factor